jgi:hypothetical protein
MSKLVLSEKQGLHEQFGEKEEIGGNHFRAYVGPPNYYDLIGVTQFNLLPLFGMRRGAPCPLQAPPPVSLPKEPPMPAAFRLPALVIPAKRENLAWPCPQVPMSFWPILA